MLLDTSGFVAGSFLYPVYSTQMRAPINGFLGLRGVQAGNMPVIVVNDRIHIQFNH